MNKYSASSCRGTVTTETFSMDSCVATPSTSSALSLGYNQWSYATLFPVPLLTGYLNLMTFAVQNSCRSPIFVETFKVNDCLIGSDGYASISTISEYSYTYVKTQYSDGMCTSKTGIFDVQGMTVNDCIDFNRNVGSTSPYQPMSDAPMVMLRYFS